MKSLLILGAGHLGEITKEIAEAMGCYDKIDFLDDMSNKVIGKLEEYASFTDRYTDAIIAINDINVRISYFERLKQAGYTLPVLIHPTAFVAPSAHVAEGTIIEPMAFVHTGTLIGRGCIICEGAVISHHSYVDEFCFIATHATVIQNTYMRKQTNTVAGQLFFAEPGKRPSAADSADYSFDSGM